ncbi:hypothetical protein EV182_003533 [Spiromyces aspiralis]|uniref:Uncharacterized protein n=1 Tax=Spiromyces aspiralis TaxID=68401 RepID=A0ACC1HQZ3_9FUNG|nr:hypothetical protein EV182_003533 [Spiromyces aspiralis]
MTANKLFGPGANTGRGVSGKFGLPQAWASSTGLELSSIRAGGSGIAGYYESVGNGTGIGGDDGEYFVPGIRRAASTDQRPSSIDNNSMPMLAIPAIEAMDDTDTNQIYGDASTFGYKSKSGSREAGLRLLMVPGHVKRKILSGFGPKDRSKSKYVTPHTSTTGSSATAELVLPSGSGNPASSSSAHPTLSLKVEDYDNSNGHVKHTIFSPRKFKHELKNTRRVTIEAFPAAIKRHLRERGKDLSSTSGPDAKSSSYKKRDKYASHQTRVDGDGADSIQDEVDAGSDSVNGMGTERKSAPSDTQRQQMQSALPPSGPYIVASPTTPRKYNSGKAAETRPAKTASTCRHHHGILYARKSVVALVLDFPQRTAIP